MGVSLTSAYRVFIRLGNLGNNLRKSIELYVKNL